MRFNGVRNKLRRPDDPAQTQACERVALAHGIRDDRVRIALGEIALDEAELGFCARHELAADPDAGNAPPAASSDAPLPSGALSLPDAVNKQMGLRLVRGKAPTQVVVIDSVSKPTPN